MAHYDKAPLPGGEMSARFIEFVLMHAQQASFFLGKIPDPQTNEAHVNLELAKFAIDQLEMIREKTRGNLSEEESKAINNALASLQLAYVEAQRDHPRPERPCDSPVVD
jgi:hypothetical protein